MNYDVVRIVHIVSDHNKIKEGVNESIDRSAVTAKDAFQRFATTEGKYHLFIVVTK